MSGCSCSGPKCESCGMPMTEDKMRGGGKADNPYCCYCCNEAGDLKSRDDVRQGMANFFMQHQGKPREEAEKAVDEIMAQMPVWKC